MRKRNAVIVVGLIVLVMGILWWNHKSQASFPTHAPDIWWSYAPTDPFTFYESDTDSWVLNATAKFWACGNGETIDIWVENMQGDVIATWTYVTTQNNQVSMQVEKYDILEELDEQPYKVFMSHIAHPVKACLVTDISH